MSSSPTWSKSLFLGDTIPALPSSAILSPVFLWISVVTNAAPSRFSKLGVFKVITVGLFLIYLKLIGTRLTRHIFPEFREVSALVISSGSALFVDKDR